MLKWTSKSMLNNENSELKMAVSRSPSHDLPFKELSHNGDDDSFLDSDSTDSRNYYKEQSFHEFNTVLTSQPKMKTSKDVRAYYHTERDLTWSPSWRKRQKTKRPAGSLTTSLSQPSSPSGRNKAQKDDSARASSKSGILSRFRSIFRKSGPRDRRSKSLPSSPKRSHGKTDVNENGKQIKDTAAMQDKSQTRLVRLIESKRDQRKSLCQEKHPVLLQDGNQRHLEGNRRNGVTSSTALHLFEGKAMSTTPRKAYSIDDCDARLMNKSNTSTRRVYGVTPSNADKAKCIKPFPVVWTSPNKIQIDKFHKQKIEVCSKSKNKESSTLKRMSFGVTGKVAGEINKRHSDTFVEFGESSTIIVKSPLLQIPRSEVLGDVAKITRYKIGNNYSESSLSIDTPYARDKHFDEKKSVCSHLSLSEHQSKRAPLLDPGTLQNAKQLLKSSVIMNVQPNHHDSPAEELSNKTSDVQLSSPSEDNKKRKSSANTINNNNGFVSHHNKYLNNLTPLSTESTIKVYSPLQSPLHGEYNHSTASPSSLSTYKERSRLDNYCQPAKSQNHSSSVREMVKSLEERFSMEMVTLPCESHDQKSPSKELVFHNSTPKRREAGYKDRGTLNTTPKPMSSKDGLKDEMDTGLWQVKTEAGNIENNEKTNLIDMEELDVSLLNKRKGQGLISDNASCSDREKVLHCDTTRLNIHTKMSPSPSPSDLSVHVKQDLAEGVQSLSSLSKLVLEAVERCGTLSESLNCQGILSEMYGDTIQSLETPETNSLHSLTSVSSNHPLDESVSIDHVPIIDKACDDASEQNDAKTMCYGDAHATQTEMLGLNIAKMSKHLGENSDNDETNPNTVITPAMTNDLHTPNDIAIEVKEQDKDIVCIQCMQGIESNTDKYTCEPCNHIDDKQNDKGGNTLTDGQNVRAANDCLGISTSFGHNSPADQCMDLDQRFILAAEQNWVKGQTDNDKGEDNDATIRNLLCDQGAASETKMQLCIFDQDNLCFSEDSFHNKEDGNETTDANSVKYHRQGDSPIEKMEHPHQTELKDVTENVVSCQIIEGWTLDTEKMEDTNQDLDNGTIVFTMPNFTLHNEATSLCHDTSIVDQQPMNCIKKRVTFNLEQESLSSSNIEEDTDDFALVENNALVQSDRCTESDVSGWNDSSLSSKYSSCRESMFSKGNDNVKYCSLTSPSGISCDISWVQIMAGQESPINDDGIHMSKGLHETTSQPNTSPVTDLEPRGQLIDDSRRCISDDNSPEFINTPSLHESAVPKTVVEDHGMNNRIERQTLEYERDATDAKDKGTALNSCQHIFKSELIVSSVKAQTPVKVGKPCSPTNRIVEQVTKESNHEENYSSTSWSSKVMISHGTNTDELVEDQFSDDLPEFQIENGHKGNDVITPGLLIKSREVNNGSGERNDDDNSSCRAWSSFGTCSGEDVDSINSDVTQTGTVLTNEKCPENATLPSESLQDVTTYCIKRHSLPLSNSKEIIDGSLQVSSPNVDFTAIVSEMSQGGCGDGNTTNEESNAYQRTTDVDRRLSRFTSRKNVDYKHEPCVYELESCGLSNKNTKRTGQKIKKVQRGIPSNTRGIGISPHKWNYRGKNARKTRSDHTNLQPSHHSSVKSYFTSLDDISLQTSPSIQNASSEDSRVKVVNCSGLRGEKPIPEIQESFWREVLSYRPGQWLFIPTFLFLQLLFHCFFLK